MSPLAVLVLGTAAAQVAFVAYLYSRRDLDPSRRRLGIALAATIPGVGPTLAVLAIAVRGRGSSPALHEPVAQESRNRDEYARLLGDQAPILYRLSGSRADRLAALSELARDESPAAVSALRWVMEHGEREAVVDAALTLEQMTDANMSELAAGRKLFAETEPADLIRHGDRISRMIESGLAEPSMAPRLAGLARDFYQAAERQGATIAGEMTAHWARLELRAMHPEEALAVLDRHPPVETDDCNVVIEMIRIRRDALFAARAGAGGSVP